MNLEEAIKNYAEAKENTNNAYKAYQEAKELSETYKLVLVDALAKAKLKSAKTDDYTASIVQKHNLVIKDEKAVLEWLEAHPEIESDQIVGIRKSYLDPIANEVLKQTGEIISGLKLETTESLSLRSNKPQAGEEVV